jgi:hypothetical protein
VDGRSTASSRVNEGNGSERVVTMPSQHMR